jgi:hypothetical protein
MHGAAIRNRPREIMCLGRSLTPTAEEWYYVQFLQNAREICVRNEAVKSLLEESRKVELPQLR